MVRASFTNYRFIFHYHISIKVVQTQSNYALGLCTLHHKFQPSSFCAGNWYQVERSLWTFVNLHIFSLPNARYTPLHAHDWTGAWHLYRIGHRHHLQEFCWMKLGQLLNRWLQHQVPEYESIPQYTVYSQCKPHSKYKSLVGQRQYRQCFSQAITAVVYGRIRREAWRKSTSVFREKTLRFGWTWFRNFLKFLYP